MAVKSTVTHKLDIPHEDGEWIEFKELGWRTLESAREMKARNALLSFRDLGPDFFRAVSTPPTPENTPAAPVVAEEAPEVDEVPIETYDMSILLRSSIVAWSYSVPCNEDNIDNLDQRTASWALKEILKIHFPTKASLGKVSEPSNVL